MSNQIHDHDSATEANPVCWHFRHWPARRGRPLCDCTTVCTENRRPLGTRRFDTFELS